MANKTITMATIDNVFKREEAQRKVDKLNEITQYSFYNFQFAVCPAGGTFDITVTSDYTFTGDAEKDLLQTITYVLMNQI